MLFSGSDITDLGEPSDRPSPVLLAVLEVFHPNLPSTYCLGMCTRAFLDLSPNQSCGTDTGKCHVAHDIF